MAIGAGIGASIGIKTETTFNSVVVPDHFYEFNSESTKYVKNTVVGQGLRAGGLVPRSQRRVVTTFGASGDFEIDLPSNGLGLLLAHSMGSFPTGTQITAASGGTPAVYSFQFTLGDPYTKSFTTEVGVPEYDGQMTSKKLTGCKIASFDLSVGAGDIAKGKFSIDAAGLTQTETSLSASPSYTASTNVFHFAQGTITDGAVSSPVTYANIKDFDLNVDNALKTDRYNLGSLGAKQEQIINGFRNITGKVTVEFIDTVFLAKFLADTTAGLELTFKGAGIGTSPAANFEKLIIKLPAIKFDGDTPAVSGPGVIDVTFNFTAYDNGTDAPLTITYITTDTAI